MLNTEVTEYIHKRLQAGDSPTAIAQTLHSWGWKTETTDIHHQVQARPRIFNMMLGIIITFTLFSGSIGWYMSSNAKTQSVADSVVKPETISQLPTARGTSPAANQAAVLGASTASPSSQSPTDTFTANTASTSSNLSSQSTATSSAKKSVYTIALIGDSMIDTLDSHLPMLAEKLKARYNSQFKIYNYGVGAQNVEMGLARFDQPLSYKDRAYPALSELEPDIIIIGSFAYNPFSAPDINKYWLTMAKLAESSQATGADVYFLADIAPLKEAFGTGSLDWTSDIRAAHSQKIVDQLNSFMALSKELNIPLIDMYSVSQANGQFGNGLYTDLHDGIHANNEGRTLAVDQIVKSIVVK